MTDTSKDIIITEDTTGSESLSGAPPPSSPSGSSQGWGTQAARLLTVLVAAALRYKDCLSEEWTVVCLVAPFSGPLVEWIVRRVKGGK